MSCVREQKQILRRAVRSRLRELDREELLRQSTAVWDRVFALLGDIVQPEGGVVRVSHPSLNARKQPLGMGIFLSMPRGEIDTSPGISAVFASHVVSSPLKNIHSIRDVSLYIPRVGLDFEACDMDMVRVGSVEELTSFPVNRWGIPEPPKSNAAVARPGNINVLIMPGVAFDRSGGRLGQGKGYYDRFIEKMTADPGIPPPLLVAVGLDCQLIGEWDYGNCSTGKGVPISEHDRPMDYVVLPNETIKCEATQSS